MELELGLKITKTLDGSQSADFRIAKDRGGPLFLSQQTETMFVLTAHLKGYKQDDVKININQDGTLIEITGERTVQEMVMKGWVMFKKDPEIRGFKKTFRIPQGVILDRIKAKYDEEESMLTIYMPKESKGKTGDQIEEVKDGKIVTDQDMSKDVEQANQTDETLTTSKRKEEEKVSEGHEQEIQEDEGSGVDESSRRQGDESKEGEIKEEKVESSKRGGREGKDIHELEQSQQTDEEGGPKTSEDYHQESEKNVAKKTSRLFPPCFFMGSAIVASLVVLVFSLIRPKKKQS